MVAVARKPVKAQCGGTIADHAGIEHFKNFFGRQQMGADFLAFFLNAENATGFAFGNAADKDMGKLIKAAWAGKERSDADKAEHFATGFFLRFALRD